MISLKDFRIPRRSKHCLKCKISFVSGVEYFSLLKETERHDFCVLCWQSEKGIYWKSKVPEQQSENKNRNERALDLLREEPETEMGGVLALYLTRKKVIALRGEMNQCMLYEVLETEEMLAVKKVEFTKLDMQGIQEQISKKLTCKSS